MRPNLDYFQLLADARREIPSDLKRLHVAVMSDCAAQHLILLLKALFLRRGIHAEIYEGPFDGIDFDARNPGSALYAFEPEYVVIINSVQMLRDRFYQREEVASFSLESLQRMAVIWDSIRINSNATIIQSTFAPPVERFFGNYDRSVKKSLSSVVADLNSMVVSETGKRQGILLLDLESTAARIGLNSWFDERMWTLGKSLCSFAHLPLVAQNVVDIVLATQGYGIKCVVTDLDNTLWGGVVGDDGPHGIRIGAHGDGEPFYRVQCFLRELKRRGIVLAVCSKNEYAAALKPFQENSEMVLQLNDFVAFVANWNNKPENIRTIQQTLNIGLDSILFLDDNRFEREAVRAMLPAVVVPELPEDTADWIKTLTDLNLFETVSFSAEDKLRSSQYVQEARRRTAAETAGNFEEFLRSLEMTIEVSRFIPEHIGRIVQLLQRSNQFNLTTRRHNEAECAAMMRDVRGWIPLYAKLADKYGDHGLISIVILKPDHGSGVLEIKDWLMSCRVLTRGVEEYLMNYVFEQAREMNLPMVRGTYIPTSKNRMVAEFYGPFGFAKTHVAPDGRSEWALAVSDYKTQRHFLTAEADQTVCAAASWKEERWNKSSQNA